MSEIRKFPGRIARWVDADTCRVDIDQGFYDWKLNRELRLFEYDAPELRSKSQKERNYAIFAFETMEKLFPVGTEITIISYPQKRGKYGRVLGNFETKDAVTWLSALITGRFVVPYGEHDDEELARIWEARYDLWQEKTNGQ